MQSSFALRGLELWCLTPLSIIFQLYRGCQHTTNVNYGKFKIHIANICSVFHTVCVFGLYAYFLDSMYKHIVVSPSTLRLYLIKPWISNLVHTIIVEN
jgi:hypothetical protein